MLGAIIGDIIGSRWEFNPTNDYNFELFSDKNSYTDDTVCTIAVADAVMQDSDDYTGHLQKWCHRYPNPMGGYGSRFAKWLETEHPKPYGSFGNGSAMRVSPIGWWFEQPGELLDEARKSAECTHNHEEGIQGAIAVVMAIRDCRILRKDMKGKNITKDDIRVLGLDHAIQEYAGFGQNLNINIEDYRNKFDETCKGTVPVALAIIENSTSFEDAIRQAVSLGADADTLGAIVGSIAEALWGIPEWMKKKALTYLPKDMRLVISNFHRRLNRLRKLTQQCEYYLVGDFRHVEEKHQVACDIEREWSHHIAQMYNNADLFKYKMSQRWPLEQWQEIADTYDLPVTLVGFIGKHVLTPKHKTSKVLIKFLDEHYSARKPAGAKKKQEKAEKQHFMAIMHWKLGLGNFNKVVNGESPLPVKGKTATAGDWKTEPMPINKEYITTMKMDLSVPNDVMEILRKGHIPDVQEDHWFMYCDDEYIRYYRSWTGMCAFEAHYLKESDCYRIDELTINHALAEFGVNGDDAGAWLFRYLIIAETGGDVNKAWQEYLNAWEKINEKYSQKKGN